MSKNSRKHQDLGRRIALAALSTSLLAIIFIGQHFDYASIFGLQLSHQWSFIFNRIVRFILNDNLVLLLIFAIFYERKYVKFGLAVEAFGFIFLLLPYFFLRYGTEVDHMYISFIHRLIINPTLMVLLIPAIYIQRNRTS